MTNEVIIAADSQTDNPMLTPAASREPLGERLLKVTEADLKMIQGQGLDTEFANSFDNHFDNGFKNIA